MVMALTISLFACESTPPEVSQTSSPTASPTPTETASPPSSPTVEEAQLAVYWLQYNDEKLDLYPAQVTLDGVGTSPTEQLTAAMERLLQGPANADMTTTIPDGTQLNTLKVEEDGVYVDLTQEFTTGGGSTSMQGRLAQIVYTASSLAPQDGIWISIDGEPLKVLGGEGLEISQPITRQEFKKEFSL